MGPRVQLKDGWTVSSANGIASANVDFTDSSGATTQVWGYPRPGQPGGADKVTGKYQWSQQANSDETGLDGSATDELGNTAGGDGGGYILAPGQLHLCELQRRVAD
jgi:hypothetical protein